ncbi:MAG: 50S ribosomal protein L21, partial [Xanthomonadaceae bacterium]|nr:50S ribosomal protein L21 [Xanthomonadaceae bacterium]
MYAVVVTGGKQYRVMKGETLRVELIDAEPGANIEINDVLLVGDGDKVTVGAPKVAGAKVTATVKGH